MTNTARYDGFAEWYDEHLTEFSGRATALLVDLLGNSPGLCLDVGCGGGIHLPAIAAAGWSIVGLDISVDQLRFAQRRSSPAPRLVAADAIRLPFADEMFDAVVTAFVHTDVDDWSAVVSETVRVLRPGGRLVYVGTHPCFVGPFSRYPAGSDPPVLHLGYRATGWTTEGPGLGEGLRRRVGVRRLTLAGLLNSLATAGLHLDRFEEPGPEDFPKQFALVGHR